MATMSHTANLSRGAVFSVKYTVPASESVTLITCATLVKVYFRVIVRDTGNPDGENSVRPGVLYGISRRIPPLRPPRSEREELMDAAEVDRDELVECLEDLARGNLLSGGRLLTLRALSRLTARIPPGSEVSILDVATGGGDFPRSMARWASRKGYVPRVVATDASPEIFALAAGMRPGYSSSGPRIRYETADALSLEYPDDSFDFATCSLFLHHLGPSGAIKLLGELGRVSRKGIVVNDLVRSWVGYFGTVAFTRATSTNRLFRHDGPMSVRKAYTRDEMRSLVRDAGLPEPLFVGIPGYRVAMTIPPTPPTGTK